MLADFLSPPMSQRLRSTGEPLKESHAQTEETQALRETPPVRQRCGSFTSLSSGQSEGTDGMGFHASRTSTMHPSGEALVNVRQKRGRSPGTSFSRCASASLMSFDARSHSKSSLENEDIDEPSTGMKRRSLRLIGLHRLSRRAASDEDNVQIENSDFFQIDDYADFTSKRSSQSKRYFSRLSSR